MMSDTDCQRCNSESDDLRLLKMSCGYDMAELAIPFEKIDVEGQTFYFYVLRVCKKCRAEWLAAQQTWFETKPNREPIGSGIFVRRHGANVEISQEEWDRLNPGRIPVRVKPR